MERRRVVAVIPARYSSTRFPGKPLVLLHGRPMVVHVVDRVVESCCCAEVIVATDDERIAAAATAGGARAVMTGPARSGTDRVAQALRNVYADVVLNVQGDEPALPPANLATLADFLLQQPDVPLATLAAPADDRDMADPNVVKVVCDLEGMALYFSRSPVPYPRTPGAAPRLRHVGLYGFQREALLDFTSWSETELEKAEGLEQLRALAHGMKIKVLPALAASVSVDRPDDVPRAEAALSRLKGGV